MTDATCTRCGRPLAHWPLKRPPVCAPARWAHCIRPHPQFQVCEWQEGAGLLLDTCDTVTHNRSGLCDRHERELVETLVPVTPETAAHLARLFRDAAEETHDDQE